MSYRPGGLTALAILNLIFGAMGTLASLVGLATTTFIDKIADKTVDENGEKIADLEKLAEELGGMKEYLYIALIISIIAGIVMFIAGIGYLGQKKFLGRTLGLVYGALSIFGTGLGLAFGQSFGISAMISIIYPLLTIVLLLTVFKDDFIN